MRFLALGPVEAVVGTRPAKLGGPKPKALIAALLAEPRRVVPVERLVSLVWDGEPPESAMAMVHSYVSVLRRAVGPDVLLTRAPGYLLDVGPQDNDVEVFRDLVGRARAARDDADHALAARYYDQGLALWRGPAFDGVAAPFAEHLRSGLEELRLAAEAGRAHAELALGRQEELVPRLFALVAAHPMRESLITLLMDALHRSGRQADALAVYTAARRRLIDELGVEPGPELRAHHALVLGGVRPVQGTAGGPNQLPPAIPDLLGRQRELAEILHVLRARRGAMASTVVLTGVGGVGKTTLAVHAAHVLRAEFPDGQLFADLRGATVGQVMGRFLLALGVARADLPADPDERVELYRMRAAGRRLVVVLDDARDDQELRKLFPGTGSCAVLVTSRQRLSGVEGVEPVELTPFDDRLSARMLARIVGTARVSAEPAATAAVLRACEGLPLVLRVAGAKLLARPHWSVRLLADRLADPDRVLGELAAGGLEVRAGIRRAYEDLDALEQRVFRRVAECGLADPVPWVAERLRLPVPVVEEAVEGLVDHRLLDVSGVDGSGTVHYRMSGLVRAFGAALADEPLSV